MRGDHAPPLRQTKRRLLDLKKGRLFSRYAVTPTICLDTALPAHPQRSVAPLFCNAGNQPGHGTTRSRG